MGGREFVLGVFERLAEVEFERERSLTGAGEASDASTLAALCAGLISGDLRTDLSSVSDRRDNLRSAASPRAFSLLTMKASRPLLLGDASRSSAAS
mmetsp:Transcript_128971/g.210198  ORF Transcript_128971/g.210198 Transcript_128971/m.210198 type:complete len:96 (+) Transcript_128971:199-486(+)